MKGQLEPKRQTRHYRRYDTGSFFVNLYVLYCGLVPSSCTHKKKEKEKEREEDRKQHQNMELVATSDDQQPTTNQQQRHNDDVMSDVLHLND